MSCNVVPVYHGCCCARAISWAAAAARSHKDAHNPGIRFKNKLGISFLSLSLARTTGFCSRKRERPGSVAETRLLGELGARCPGDRCTYLLCINGNDQLGSFQPYTNQTKHLKIPWHDTANTRDVSWLVSFRAKKVDDWRPKRGGAGSGKSVRLASEEKNVCCRFLSNKHAKDFFRWPTNVLPRASASDAPKHQP